MKYLGLILASAAACSAHAGDLNARNWQLFIDNFAVARGTGFDRVVHHPRPMGVVIDADRPWETHGVNPGHIMRLPDGSFVAYYSAVWWMPGTDARSSSQADVVYDHGAWRTRRPDSRPQDRDQQYVGAEAYATSRDGIHWVKPNLGLVDAPTGIDWKKLPPFPSPTGCSKDNNLGVPFGITDLGQYGNVRDPARRFAVTVGGQAFFSARPPDFIHDPDWKSKLTPTGGTFSPRSHGLNFWDDQHHEWVAIVQNAVPHWLPTREIARFYSPDLIHWRSDIVLDPDPEDPHGPLNYEEPMTLEPFVSDGVVLGLLSWFHGDRSTPDGGPVLDRNAPEERGWQQGWPWPTTASHPYVWPFARKGVNEMRITISRDGGWTWDRTSSREAWVPHGTEQDSYDRLVLFAGPPVRVGEEDWFYMSVHNGDHLASRVNAERTPYYHDRARISRIALYIQKHNRYVSLSTGSQVETLITRPFTVSGDTLRLNADASRGEIRVGIYEYKAVPTLGKQLGQSLPSDGAQSLAPHLMEKNLLPGFTLEDCKPILSNGVDTEVSFKNGASLRSLAGRRVVLFVRVANADLYGFRLE